VEDHRVEPCYNGTPAFTAEGEIQLLSCGSWTCPHCGLVNAFHWALRVHYGIALWRPKPAYFWTLTLPAWVERPQTGYSILPARFKNFANKLRYRLGAWYYVAFVEEHPHRNFIPHFHIISLQKSPERLKDLANSAGFGYQAMEVPIDGAKAAWYVSKYTTKQGFEMPRRFRRVRVCQAWPSLPDPIYETQVYPMLPRETVRAYCARISDLVGLDAALCEIRYFEAALAARTKRMEVQAKVQQHPLQTFDKTPT
jgi:hypothetical protein